MKMKRWTGLLLTCLMLAVMFVTLPEASAWDSIVLDIGNAFCVETPMPEIGETPDFDPAIVSIVDPVSYIQSTSAWSYAVPGGIQWTDVTDPADPHVMQKTDQFQWKHVYKLEMSIGINVINATNKNGKSYDGFRLYGSDRLFNLKCTAKDGTEPVNVFVGCERFDKIHYTILYAKLSYTFPAITAPLAAEAVPLLDVNPQAGTPAGTGVIPADAHYTTSGIDWYYNGALLNGELDYCRSYTLKMSLIPNESYHFTNKGWDDWRYSSKWCTSSKATFKDRNEVDIVCEFTMPCLVTFSAWGGTGEMAPVELKKDTVYTLPPCGFTAPELYEFDKWNLGAPGEQVKITENTEIKALWKVKTAEQTDPGITEQLISLKLKGLKATASGNKAIKLSWTKLKKKDQKKVGKFVIEISTDKKFTKDVITKTVSAKKNSVTIKKLKPGKKYYIRIRAVKEEGNIRYVTKWFKKSIKLAKK